VFWDFIPSVISEDRDVFIFKVASSFYSLVNRGSLLRIKRMEREAERWLQSRAETENAWSCTSIVPSVVFLAYRGTT